MPKTRTSRAGSLVTIDLSPLRGFVTSLRKAAPEVNREMRRGLRRGGDIVRDEAKELSSWSTRIPGSIRVRTVGIRVSVIAGDKNAPHAAAFEHEGVPGFFRHPVFGNRSVWVDQRARAYLRPAAEASASEVSDAILQAVSEAIDKTLSASGAE